MCYSKSLTKSEKIIEDHFQQEFEVPLLYEPYYYISGFQYPNVFIIPQDDPASIWPAIWGLVPKFAMNDVAGFRTKANTLNARSESVFTTPSFQDSIVNKRCLIIADGFYEPHHDNGNVYPYYCKFEDHSLFAFAGLYTKLDDALYSCSIITVEADSFFSKINNKKRRMPLVLDKEFEQEWLRLDLKESHVKELMRAGFTSNNFKAFPVRRDLYEQGHHLNTSQAIVRVDYPELGQQQFLF